MEAGGGTVATLGVRVQSEGTEQVKADLLAIGVTGEAAATKVGQAFGGSKVQQAFQQNATGAQQFGAALTRLSSQDISTAVERYDRMIEAQKRSAMSMADLEKEADRVSAAARRMALAETEAMEMNDAFNGKFIESRAVVLAHEQALGMDAAMLAANAEAQKAAGLAAGGHGLQLGRLRQELGTLVGRITGTSTALDRMGGALGSMVAGNAVVIGVLAGIAAIGYAWEKMKSDAEKTADAVKKSMKDVHDDILKAQLGMGDLQQAAAQAAVDKAQKAYDAANKANSGVGGVISGGTGAKDAKKTLDEALAVLQHYQQQKTQIDNAIRVESERTYTQEQAALVAHGVATAAQQSHLLDLWKRNEAEIQRLNASQTDNVRVQQLIQQNDAIKSAFDSRKAQSKEVGNVMSYEEGLLTAALTKQLEEWRKLTNESADSMRAAEQENALAKVQGEAHDLLASKYKAEDETVKALRESYGVVLVERLAAIDAERKQRDETIRQTQATNDQKDAAQKLNEMSKDAARIAAIHTAAIKADAAASVEQAAAYDKIKASLGGDLLRGIEQFASKGITSFRSFFQEVASMAARMVDQISKAITDTTKLSASQVSQLKMFQGAAGVAGIAASSGLEGYQIGSQTTNLGKGALGGAASGALTGAAIGSVVPVIGTAIGAVVGGLAGAVGGLMGAADAHKKAAAALEKAAEQTHVSLLQMNAQAGTGTVLDANLAQFKQQADALYDAIDAALPGLENQVEREKELAQVRRDQAIITAALIEAEKNQRASNIQDYNQRTLTANAVGGSLEEQNFAAMQNLQLNQAREMTAAINRHASQDELNALAASQAADRRNEQNREDEAIRQRDLATVNAAIQAKLDEAAADRQAAIDVLNDQLKTANDQLTATRSQLQAQQQAVNATKQVVDTLKTFSQSLLVGSLSTLSPIDQLNAAKAQRDTLFQQARAGDQNSATQYTGAAQAYLQAAKDYFASSPGYASAFSDTQSQTDTLSHQFGTQLDVQQSILATLQAANDKLEQQIAVLQKQLDIATGSRADQLLAEVQGHGDATTVTRVAGELAKLGYGLMEGVTQLANGNSAPDYNYSLYNRPLPTAADTATPGGGYDFNDSTGQYDIPRGSTNSSANTTSTMVQAGANGIMDKLDLVLAALETNTTATRRGLEAVTAKL